MKIEEYQRAAAAILNNDRLTQPDKTIQLNKIVAEMRSRDWVWQSKSHALNIAELISHLSEHA